MAKIDTQLGNKLLKILQLLAKLCAGLLLPYKVSEVLPDKPASL